MDKDRLIFVFKFYFNIGLILFLGFALIFDFLKIVAVPEAVFILLSVVGVIPTVYSAITHALQKKPSVDLLASMALIFSFVAGEWHSAAFINLMLSSARIFDIWTEQKTKNIIKYLLKYRPNTAKVNRAGQTIEIPTENIVCGDLVIIGSGERISVDGTVISGQASVNQSTLTGESEPVLKKTGDQVLTSTLNENGSLIVRAEKVGEDSAFAKIIKLVDEASRKKSKTEKLADKFTIIYVSLVLVGSFVLFFFLNNSTMVLAFLLVVCADDLAVAIPLAFTVSISRSAQKGILIKGSNIIEKLSKIDVFMTDKTGTLTYGRPEIKDIVVAGTKKDEFLKLLGSSQLNSKHPLSLSVINYLKKRNIKLIAPDKVDERPGEGIIAFLKNKEITSGRIDFLEKRKIKITKEYLDVMEKYKNKGYGITAVGLNSKFIGFIAVEDKLRPTSKMLIERTKKLGVKIWIMLTGDNERVAAKVANELGIDQYQPNLKPQEKLKYIENYKRNNEGILGMIGDGVNDAAALAMADVSVAMGKIGSDAAIEAADITLVHDNLNEIPEAIALSRETIKVIRQNFIIWGITNGIGLILVSVQVLGPDGAAAYNFLTDFFPIFNSLKIRFPKASNL